MCKIIGVIVKKYVELQCYYEIGQTGGNVPRHYRGFRGVIRKWTLHSGAIAISPKIYKDIATSCTTTTDTCYLYLVHCTW